MECRICEHARIVYVPIGYPKSSKAFFYCLKYQNTKNNEELVKNGFKKMESMEVSDISKNCTLYEYRADLLRRDLEEKGW